MIYEVELRAFGTDGAIYIPLGLDSPPGIVVLHGSEGAHSGWSHFKSLWLAQRGFATHPCPYSQNGDAWTAGDIVDVEIDRTEESLLRFRREACPGRKVGLFGSSRGAEHALLLASLMASDPKNKWLPDAIATHAATDVVAGPFRRAWAHDPESRDPHARAWKWRGSSDRLPPGAPINIELYKGPLFLSHGTEDPIWPCERTRQLEARLRSAGRLPDVHYYPGQGHSLDPAAANENHRRLVAFFERHLRPNSP